MHDYEYQVCGNIEKTKEKIGLSPLFGTMINSEAMLAQEIAY